MEAKRPSGILYTTPAPAAPPTPPYAPPLPPRERGLTSAGIAAIVIIGVVIFFIGAILCNASVITETARYTYPYEEEWQKKVENSRLIYKIGTIIATTGALVACVGIFTGALASTKLDLALRIAMLSVGTAIIIVTLIIMLLGGVMGRTTAY
ncbi:MAG: hypothetical protein AB1485_08970 [Candidatus Thermoplasmatota archaeon]